MQSDQAWGNWPPYEADGCEVVFRDLCRRVFGVQRILWPDKEGLTDSEKCIMWASLDVCFMLLSKNLAYGDSALKPLRVFSNGLDADAGLRVRLDDKLSRLMSQGLGEAEEEDALLDLIGYLLLWRIQRAAGGQK